MWQGNLIPRVGVFRWPYGIRRWFADCECGHAGKRHLFMGAAVADALSHSASTLNEGQTVHVVRDPLVGSA